MTCAAYQASDQMTCACGLAWDVNDPDPPRCRRQRHVEPGRVPVAVRRAVEVERRASMSPPVARMPAELPENVAHMMAIAYERARRETSGLFPVDAMRAAYRVLLDRLGE